MRVDVNMGTRVTSRAFRWTVCVLVVAMVSVAFSYQAHVISSLQRHLDTVHDRHALAGHRVRRDVEDKDETTAAVSLTTVATQPPSSSLPTTTTTAAAPQPQTPPAQPRPTHGPAQERTSGGGGATYIRWGKLGCAGPDTETVYSGSAGGSNSNAEGGASEFLCLPTDPQWGSYNEILEGTGEIYGVEFEMNNFPFIVHRNGPEILRSHNMPCAVCHTKTRGVSLMVPARIECYPGWTREYHGYLVSGHKLHKGRSMYACVDQMPDVEPAGFRRDTSASVYTVDAVCGSLPCPPYFQGRELACAVCTK